MFWSIKRVLGVARDLNTLLSKKIGGQRQEIAQAIKAIESKRSEIKRLRSEIERLRTQIESQGQEPEPPKNELHTTRETDQADKTRHKPENNGAELDIPTFSEAVKQFQNFLAGPYISPELLWVFREDVVYRKGHIFVKEPLPEENSRICESLYERGRQQESGIRLETLCLLGSHPCCYVWLPEDPINENYTLLLMSKLAMSVPIALQPAHSVRNPLTWQLYKLFEGKADSASPVERLPRRNSNERL